MIYNAAANTITHDDGRACISVHDPMLTADKLFAFADALTQVMSGEFDMTRSEREGQLEEQLEEAEDSISTIRQHIRKAQQELDAAV